MAYHVLKYFVADVVPRRCSTVDKTYDFPIHLRHQKTLRVDRNPALNSLAGCTLGSITGGFDGMAAVEICLGDWTNNQYITMYP